jgi:hypothetical protein
MGPARKHDIATVRTLIHLHQKEEKRLRILITNPGSPQIRVQAEFDLERLLIRIKALSKELVKLERA